MKKREVWKAKDSKSKAWDILKKNHAALCHWDEGFLEEPGRVQMEAQQAALKVLEGLEEKEDRDYINKLESEIFKLKTHVDTVLDVLSGMASGDNFGALVQ